MARALIDRRPQQQTSSKLGRPPSIVPSSSFSKAPFLELPSDIADICRKFVFSTEVAGPQRPHYELLIGANTYKGNHEQVVQLHYPFIQDQIDESGASMLVLYASNAPVAEKLDSDWMFDGKETSDYHDAEGRFLRTWQFIANGCLPFTFDWFVQIDDDTALSIGRISTLIRTLESQVGSPQHVSAMFGRHAVWDNSSMQGFGGNGLLVTSQALRDLATVPSETWDKTVYQVDDYDESISNLAHQRLPRIRKYWVHRPFGLAEGPGTYDGTDNIHNELYKCHGLASCFANLGGARLTISLHKADVPNDFLVSHLFFQSYTPTLDDYAALVNEWTYMDG